MGDENVHSGEWGFSDFPGWEYGEKLLNLRWSPQYTLSNGRHGPSKARCQKAHAKMEKCADVQNG